jgi:hypothetical protein
MWKRAILAVVLTFGIAEISCGGSDCEGACECVGSECACPDSGDCYIDCVDECDLTCSGSGNCEFYCDDLCLVDCTGSGECLVSTGDDSDITCTGSGGCDVDCDGDCNITCPGQGVCTVHCEPEFECNIDSCPGSVTECPDGVQVCNGNCPS